MVKLVPIHIPSHLRIQEKEIESQGTDMEMRRRVGGWLSDRWVTGGIQLDRNTEDHVTWEATDRAPGRGPSKDHRGYDTTQFYAPGVPRWAEHVYRECNPFSRCRFASAVLARICQIHARILGRLLARDSHHTTTLLVMAWQAVLIENPSTVGCKFRL